MTRAIAWRRELARKAIHLTSVVVPVALALGIPRRSAAIVLGALVGVALLVELARAATTAGRRWFDALFAPLLRVHEGRALTGATWLLASMCAGVALLPREAAIAATWAAAVGDTAAALVGMRFGRHRSTRDGKSVEGTLACGVATFVGAWLLARLPIPLALAVSVVAAVSERLPWPRDDNARLVALVGITAVVGRRLSG
ncbi:MAG TPA: hypothetical protein VHM30_16850 [Gemmatimonadaceae bacterium]|nr:hypothetical protein [Gemmatimonadaceae bacterium]